MVDEVAAALATAARLRFCLGGALGAAEGAGGAEGAEGAEAWVSGVASRLRRAACVVHGGVAAYAWRPAGGGGGGGAVAAWPPPPAGCLLYTSDAADE